MKRGKLGKRQGQHFSQFFIAAPSWKFDELALYILVELEALATAKLQCTMVHFDMLLNGLRRIISF